jgi:hypothetical protein
LASDCDGLSLPVSLPEKGLELLTRASRFAEATACDIWYFAISIAELEAAGLGTSDLRWLIAAGYAQHADELTHPAETQRRFGPIGLAAITPRSCFALTREGAEALERLLAGRTRSSDGRSESEPTSHCSPSARQSTPVWSPGELKPRWDPDRRELTLGQTVIKRFRVPARNQELLLSVFQEQDWPPLYRRSAQSDRFAGSQGTAQSRGAMPEPQSIGRVDSLSREWQWDADLLGASCLGNRSPT